MTATASNRVTAIVLNHVTASIHAIAVDWNAVAVSNHVTQLVFSAAGTKMEHATAVLDLMLILKIEVLYTTCSVVFASVWRLFTNILFSHVILLNDLWYS